MRKVMMSLVSVRRRVGWAQPPPGGLVSSAARGRRVVLRRVAEAGTPPRGGRLLPHPARRLPNGRVGRPATGRDGSVGRGVVGRHAAGRGAGGAGRQQCAHEEAGRCVRLRGAERVVGRAGAGGEPADSRPAALGGLAVMRVPYFDSALAVLSFAAMTVAWVVGLVMRRWRRDREAAMARAVAAERARAVAAQRAVFAERLHFARDLHDVVSHTLSVIAVQAGVARYQFADPTSPVGAALTAIEQASRTALDDLRRMLGVMRAEPTGGGDDAEM